MSQLETRINQLSSHDRALAQAQLARAEAIIDTLAAVGAGLRKLGRALVGPIVAGAQAFTARRTRRWPHDHGRSATPEFPSTGLQH